jgi:chromosome partitioning protein
MAKNPPILPINGKHLARYITYVRGSRLAGLNSAIIPPDCLFDADRIVKRSPTQTKVVTIANNKGGVGKTTTALHLALQLAEMEQRVLLIDLEEQTNLSDSLPNPFDGRQTPHIVDYFTKRGPLPALVRPTPFDRVWIVPGHRQVHLVDTNTPLFYPVELQFMHDVHDSSLIPPVYQNSAFDWIILDTSPNMSLRTRAALAAAHYVLAPTKTSEYDLQGLERLLETISTMNGLRGDNAVLLGAVVTQWDEKQANRAALLNLEGDLAKLKVRLFDARIPFDSGLSRTPGTAYKPSRNPSAGIAQYRELAKEVIRYVSGS